MILMPHVTNLVRVITNIIPGVLNLKVLSQNLEEQLQIVDGQVKPYGVSLSSRMVIVPAFHAGGLGSIPGRVDIGQCLSKSQPH